MAAKNLVRGLLFTGVMAFCGGDIVAQNFLDLKRYSQTMPMGTARSMGMGGGLGALGADYTVGTINPASLAQFRTNQAVFTAALNFGGNRANYIGSDARDSKFNFSLPNMGLIVSTVRTSRGKDVTSGVVNYTFGFGFSRINDFNRNATIEAVNRSSSYLNSLAELATQNIDFATFNDEPLFPEELGLVANTIVDRGTNDFAPNNINPGTAMRQTYRIQQSGRQTDWNVSFAANVSNILYLGVSLGLPAIRFNQTETIGETSQDSSLNPDRSFEQINTLSTSGNGVNAKLGIMLRFTDWLRIGAAYHTPTAYSLTDNFSYSFRSAGFSGGHYAYNGQELLAGPFNSPYSFTTPGKVVLSIGFINQKIWSVGVDFESIDYKTAQTSTADLGYINRDVQQNLKNANNIRVGGEYNFLDFRFRAGYAFYSQPFNDRITSQLKEGNLNTRVYSGGVGYQEPNTDVYFDAAVVYQRYDEFYTPYTLQDQSMAYYSALSKVSSTRFVFTLGLKF